MKRLIFIIIICFKISGVYAQDSAEYYIEHLSWESLFIKPTYATELVLNKDAEKLVAYKNDYTIKKLLSAISDNKKTVAIHMILSRMLEPHNINFTQERVYRGDSIIAVNYRYNTLLWRYDVSSGAYDIDCTAVSQIKEYWQKKLTGLQKQD